MPEQRGFNKTDAYFQNTFQNEMHQRWRYDTVFGNIMDHVCTITFSYFLEYQTFAWHVTVTCRSDFAGSLTDSVSVKKSFSTYKLSHTEWLWLVFFFLTHFLTRLPTIFTEVNDWLYFWNYVGLMFYVYIVWKILLLIKIRT